MIPDGVFCQYLSRINGGMDFYIGQKGECDEHLYSGSEAMDGLDEALVAWTRAATDSGGFGESDE